MSGAALVRADAVAIPLADESVDLIVTSPPYFALRSYTDGGEHYDGQIGSEPTPAEFLAALWAVTAECKRVLKPSGSMWVNLGDKYSQRVATRTSSHQDGLFPDRPELKKDWKRDRELGLARMPADNLIVTASGDVQPIREKSLMGLPWRYAIGCIDQLALILRAEVIWSKPNGLPESVTDRVRRSHEQWFHFTKEPRYFAAVDEVREPFAPGSLDRIAAGFQTNTRATEGQHNNGMMRSMAEGQTTYTPNPLGKLPGSVWTVPTEPLSVPDWLDVDHFAAFPQEWPRRIILGWSPSGICTECGEGRRPVVASESIDASRPQARRALKLVAEHGLTDEHIAAVRSVGTSDTGRGAATQDGTGKNTDEVYRLYAEAREALGGYTREFLLQRPTSFSYACACPTPDAPTRPAVVLDPFGGTGTTAMVARALGRFGVSLDLSADYLRLANWRIFESGHADKTTARTNRERQGSLL